MTIKLSKPQAELLRQLQSSGDRGVYKPLKYTPAEMLIADGLARWANRYQDGNGRLVPTPRGREWGK